MKLWYALALGLFLFPVNRKAQKTVVYHERVAWSEPDFWRKPTTCTLEFWTENQDLTHCALRTRFETAAGVGQPEIWETKHTFADPLWAQIDLAIAIRVKGAKRPQLLVSRSRANWGDYILYSVEEGGLREVFSASHRDWACIRWIARNGVLERFVLYDRWQPARFPEPKGMRWQERSDYIYDTRQKQWRSTAKKWQTYRFGDPLKNPVLKKPSDCSFRFNTRS